MKKLNFPLTLFFDSYCPLCVAEMNQLEALDVKGSLRFEDIHAEDFVNRFPHIDPKAADEKLHAEYADGQLILGLDVTCQAWSSVGKKTWLVVLRWPVIRWFANMAYWVFARNRYSLSYLFTGVRRCERCSISRSSDSHLQQ